MPRSRPIMDTSIATGKIEASPSTKKLVSYQIGSHISLIDYSLCGFSTSLSHPTIPSTMGRQNPTNGCTSTLSPSSWHATMTTSKCCIFPWHSTLCLSPGLISYEPIPSILGDNFSANSVKNFTGAQRGLVLSITPNGGIIHWPDAWPDTSFIDLSHLVGVVELLPY